MALIVKVFINEREIIDLRAVRIAGNPGELCMYRDGYGNAIHHHYDDGAAALAIRLLQEHQQEEWD